jgi:hypothetical protein
MAMTCNLKVRVSEADREALEAVAHADERTVSSLLRLIIREWLAVQQIKARSRGV